MERATTRLRRHFGRFQGLLALSLASACQDDAAEADAWKDDYVFVHHGERVTVYGYDLEETEVCGGSYDALETHTRTVMDFLEVEEPASFDYRWMSNDFWRQGRCPSNARACASYGVPHTRSLPDMHEGVHMVARQSAGGGCAALLEEGLAEYLGGAEFGDRIPSEYTIPELMTIRESPGPAGYARAAHFVSFLVETYGAEGFRRLCSAVPHDHSLASWGVAIHEALGISMDELLAEYEAYPICSTQQLRARDWECNREPDFVFSPENTYYEVEAGCGDPAVTNANAHGDRGDAMLTRLVYFPADAWVNVYAWPSGDSGTPAYYMTQECVPCSADPQVHRYPGNFGYYTFRAGLHEVIVFFDKRDTVGLRMSVAHFE